MTATRARRPAEPDHVYEQMVAATGIDPAKLAAQIEREIVRPLVVKRR